MDKARKRQLNNKVWWGSIQTIEEAAYIVKSTAYGFYFLAVLQALIGYWLAGPSVLFDVVFIALFAFLLQRTKKRVFAYLLFALALIAFVVTVSNRLGASDIGGQNIILSIIFVWASVRAIQATSFLAKMKNQN